MYVGEMGKGVVFKMLVNIMFVQFMFIFFEVILFGEKMGFFKDFLFNVLLNFVVLVFFIKFKVEMVRQNDYEVQFLLEWMYKDLYLVVVIVYEFNYFLYLVNFIKEVFGEVCCKGMGCLDFVVIY